MSLLVAGCPRCKSEKITFDVLAENRIGFAYNWQHIYECFCVCRSCSKSSIFILEQSEASTTDWLSNNKLSTCKVDLNKIFRVKGYVSLKDQSAFTPPEYLPSHIEEAFKEGAACLAIGCNNAAGAMFRLCLDFATKRLLPPDSEAPNSKIRRSLGLRIEWLLENGKLDRNLADLSSCIKDDGNDGAHDGTLSQIDAEDIKDFAFILLERLFTEPQRLENARKRRDLRHQQQR
ncbi:DUF4145 domain-containing protein [Pseudomonas sp. CK-NBRI-02]|uniref:DUF4145 domain-containing protein n=1 Tax=Pseudomonas sp. CK-NBRI-02 TaxID=2249759 RepID=UPI0009B72C8C|nr:DUF4145 domain-containing protein [Pseudomonas sp. CK-NBRI-02]